MRIVGDCREVLRDLPKGSVQTCVTSPPYWGLRDYGVKRQIGLERTPEEFVEQMVEVFRLVREVLADDGTLWLNLGDGFWGGNAAFSSSSIVKAHRKDVAGRGSVKHGRHGTLKTKDLIGMPWRVAFALQADGWYLRSDIIWHKPNPMPESVMDRPTKSHEYLFLLTKGPRYFYDAEAVREEAKYGRRDTAGQWRGGAYVNQRGAQDNAIGNGGRNSVTGAHPETGRNRRTVWTIATSPFPGAHFATFPPKLVEPCILAGTSEKGHCPECGARWERVTDVSYASPPPRGGDPKIDRARYANRHETGVGYRPEKVLSKVTETLGWQPTCDHNRKPVPDVALDPFFGAGTVGMVAEQLGRDYIGIELNGKYSKLARETRKAA